MATLERRITALEAGRTGPDAPVLVILIGDDEPIGLHAVPDLLPEVDRLPGEAWEDCIARAGAMLTGALPVLLLARYAEDRGRVLT